MKMNIQEALAQEQQMTDYLETPKTKAVTYYPSIQVGDWIVFFDPKSRMGLSGRRICPCG